MFELLKINFRTVAFFKTPVTRKTEIFCLILCLLYLALGSTYSFNIYDEGMAVTGALRVLNGEVPYRDFWTMYAPGQFYLLAGIFKIFGPSLIVERIASVLILWGIAFTAWKSSKLLFSKNSALVVLIFETLWLGSYRFYGSPLATGLFLAIISTYFTLLFLKNNRSQFLFLAGIFCGLTTLIRHDLGAYTALAISFVLFTRPFRRFDRGVFKIIFKNILFFTSAVLLVILPAAAYFLTSVPAHILADQLFTFPATTFAEYRALPFPSPVDLFKNSSLKHLVKTTLEICSFYFPIAVFFTVIMIFLKRVFRKNSGEQFPPFSRIAMLCLLGIFFMMQVSVRADVSHLLPAMVPAIILGVFVFKNPSLLPGFKNLFMIGIGVFATGAMSGALYAKMMVVKDAFFEEKFVLKTERAALVSGDEFLQEYGHLLNFLKRNNSQGERIFVGNFRHDKLSGNDAILYFLSDRPPATKYHELHPGVATEENVQREIITELLKNGVQTIVLREEILTVIEPNKSSVSTNTFILDDFLKNNFSPVATFGDYTVFKKQ